MQRLVDWLQDRLGFCSRLHSFLFDAIPGPPSWRRAWGITILFAIAVEFITGFFLWMVYNPSTQSAWESVFHIQHALAFGWVLRGIHHWMADVLIVLTTLHLLQMVVMGTYRAPHEFNFWATVLMAALLGAFVITGDLLPWDQDGYWATTIKTNLAGSVPVIGDAVKTTLIGGSEYNHHTLSRFFALHAGLLPLLLLAAIALRMRAISRQPYSQLVAPTDVTHRFWPDQALRNAVGAMAAMIAVLFLTCKYGADLSAPADPTDNHPARPAWYFTSLYQLRHMFPGEQELIGTVVIPGAIFAFILLMPVIGRWKLGHAFNVLFFLGVFAGAGTLTRQTWVHDAADAGFQRAKAFAVEKADRIVQLASRPEGIPPLGAVELLRSDPLIQGPQIFARMCANCHRYDGHDGTGKPSKHPQSGPDLKRVGSRQWLTALLDPEKIASEKYFGGTAFVEGKMQKWVKRTVPDFTEEDKEKHRKALIAISAEAKLPYQAEQDAADAAIIKEGNTLLKDELECLDCHEYHTNDEDASAPWLTGYGSKAWLTDIVSNPANPKHYGKKNDRMPSFGVKKMLTEKQIELLVSWLREEWYVAPDEAAR